MRFEVLGPLRAVGEHDEVTPPRGRASATLAWLLLRAGEVVSCDSLVGVLWEQPPATAHAKARAMVREVTGMLDADVVEQVSQGWRIDPDAHQIDARRFRTLVAAAGRSLADGDQVAARVGFEQARALWRGDPYPDLANALPARSTIVGLIDLRHAVTEELNGLALRGEVDYRLVAELRAQTTLGPERPRLRCQLALALYRVDRQIEALETLRAARADLGDPVGRIAALEQAILRHDPALTRGEILT